MEQAAKAIASLISKVSPAITASSCRLLVRKRLESHSLAVNDEAILALALRLLCFLKRLLVDLLTLLLVDVHQLLS